jgi:hypothetical protein
MIFDLTKDKEVCELYQEIDLGGGLTIPLVLSPPQRTQPTFERTRRGKM